MFIKNSLRLVLFVFEKRPDAEQNGAESPFRRNISVRFPDTVRSSLDTPAHDDEQDSDHQAATLEPTLEDKVRKFVSSTHSV